MELLVLGIFLTQTYERAIFILRQILTQEVLWILAPLVITLILMEMYFGRYKEEELGWNTAFGNTLILIFISANLIHHLHINQMWMDPVRTGVVITLLFLGFVLTLIDSAPIYLPLPSIGLTNQRQNTSSFL